MFRTGTGAFENCSIALERHITNQITKSFAKKVRDITLHVVEEVNGKVCVWGASMLVVFVLYAWESVYGM